MVQVVNDVIRDELIKFLFFFVPVCFFAGSLRFNSLIIDFAIYVFIYYWLIIYSFIIDRLLVCLLYIDYSLFIIDWLAVYLLVIDYLFVYCCWFMLYLYLFVFLGTHHLPLIIKLFIIYLSI